MGFNVKLHQVRIGRCNQDLSLVKVNIRIPYQQVCLQGLDDIGILCIGLGQNAAVIDIHVCLCNIAHRYQAFQGPIRPYGWNGHNIILLHDLPCLFQGNIVRHTFGLADLDILDLGPHILHQLRLLKPKVVKHELCLPVYMPGPCRDILIPCQGALQIGITDSRADGVRIRIPVPDYHCLSF